MAGQASFGNIRFIFAWSSKRPGIMGDNCRERAKKITPALVSRLEGVAGDMLSYAQANHPWQNRTGDAERLLDFHVNATSTSGTIVGQHGVPYGGFLETGTSRMQPYPIIGPTLQAHYATVRSVMDDIAGSG